MWIFTVKYGGTLTSPHCGSQCAKHLVESSFCGTFKAGSSCSCKLVTSGRRSLCSGRKKLLTCSSVLKAFAKTMVSERVRRKLYILVSKLQDKYENSIKSFLPREFLPTECGAVVKAIFYITKQELSKFFCDAMHCHINYVFNCIVTEWAQLIRDFIVCYHAKQTLTAICNDFDPVKFSQHLILLSNENLSSNFKGFKYLG